MTHGSLAPINPGLPLDARVLEGMLRAAKAALERGIAEDKRALARNARFVIREVRNQLHHARGNAHA